MKKITLIAIALLSAVFHHHALARDYHVEVIVFERVAGDPGDTEIWDFSSASLSDEFDKMAELATRSAELEARSAELETQSVAIAQEDVLLLAKIRDNLQQNGYPIVKAVGWNQPAEVYWRAPVVSIGDEESVMPFGFLRVYKTTLIFVDIDLQLSPANNPDWISQPSVAPVLDRFDQIATANVAGNNDEDEALTPHYFIAEKRRLKFKEIHYFDHPKFGAIVGVWPIGN